MTQMDPASYILSPLFEAICLGVANLTDDPMIIDGPAVKAEVEAAFAAYEQALTTNDVAALDGFFNDAP